jgi:enamine deaminase RidA (YjgF/YER057c/UK114 family)
MERKAVNPWTWQDQFGFVQGNVVTGADKILFCSGQVSVDESGTVIHADNMAAQMGQALDNLEAVLGGAGMSLDNVVKLTIYVTDMDAAFAAFPEVGARVASFKAAQTLLGVSRLAFPGLMVEIEATAVA